MKDKIPLLRVIALILAAIFVVFVMLTLSSCGAANTNNSNVDPGNSNTAPEPELQPMSCEEFFAAEPDQPVLIEAYLQGWTYDEQYGTASLYLQNETGSYYAYRVICDDNTVKKFYEGAKIKVSGLKGYWEGFHEVKEGGTVEMLIGKHIYDTVDVTDSINDTEAMTKLQGAKVSVSNAVIAAQKLGEEEVAFLYNWDGSGAAGGNNDLYINITIGDKTYTVTVDSDEVPEGSDTYTAATELKVGDTVRLSGYMYWYQGPQIHVNSIEPTE